MNTLHFSTFLEILKAKKYRFLGCLVPVLILSVLSAFMIRENNSRVSGDRDTLEQQNTVIGLYLDSFDQTITVCDEELSVFEQQAKDNERYIQASPYMKLDPDHVIRGTLRLAVKASGEADRSRIAAALSTQVRKPGWYSGPETDPDAPYLGELISVSCREDELTVTFLHYDGKKLQAMMQSLFSYLVESSHTLSEYFGVFEIEEKERSVGITADEKVRETQQKAKELLKRAEDNRSSLREKTESKTKAKAEFSKTNVIKEDGLPGLPDSRKTWIAGICVGAVLWGFLVILLLYCEALFSGCVYSGDALCRSEIPETIVYDVKNAGESFVYASVCLRNILNESGSRSVSFCMLPETGPGSRTPVSEEAASIAEKLSVQCRQEKIEPVVFCGVPGGNAEMKAFVKTDCCVALVRAGTRMERTDELRDLCRLFRKEIRYYIVF